MARITAGMMALAAKLGPKLLTIVVKFAKVGKMGLAIGSMAAYTYLFTWQFAVVIIVSLFFHEYGHIWAMKRCRLKTKGIYFIPFMGAAAVSEEMFKTRRDEVLVAIMGPIWGFVLALATAAIYFITGNAFFAAVAGWMAMVNLFNLLPINPLDGGRIMKSIAFSINSNVGFIFLGIGIIVSMILTLWVGLILFSILLFVACIELFFEFKRYSKKEELARIVKETKEAGNVELEKEVNKILSKYPSIKDELAIPPTMTVKGIVISAISYIIIVGVLWILMTDMNHIPEVSIARELFMS